MKKILLLISLLFLVGCTNEGKSRRALENHGFTEIVFTGYSWFECSEEDTFSTGFVATNQNSETVQGTVCCGVIKGCTVRW